MGKMNTQEYEKYVVSTIGKAKLIPERWIPNPYAICSYQALQEIHNLGKAIKDMKEALEFYEDEASWEYNPINDNMTAISDLDFYIPNGCCEERGGKRARACLEKHNDILKEIK